MMIVWLPIGIGVVWVVVRTGTFFLLPFLSSASGQTVNISPWSIIGGLLGVGLLVIAILYALGRFVDEYESLFLIVPGLLIAASLFFEVFVQIVIPKASLAEWAFFGNTKTSRAAYERQVIATPYTIRYRSMHINHEVTNAQIATWECGAAPIKTNMSFKPAFAGRSLCLTVHEGLFGWEWIENLRVCSQTALAQAVQSSDCEAGSE